MNDFVSSCVMGVFVSLLGMVGLFMASRAHDLAVHAFGLGVFAFAVLFVFVLIKRAYDAPAAGG